MTGDRKPKPLTPALIRRILISLGETALVNNDELIEEMFVAATNEGANPNPMLDVEVFADVLTHDVRLYDIYNETRLTTNFNDVFFTDQQVAEREDEMFSVAATSEELLRRHKENQTIREKIKLSEELDRVYTVPFIDTTAGTYRSKGWLVTLWATIMVTFFA